MAIIKCKMCGGTLDIQEGQSVAVCEYCGTKQTLPKLDDDRKANLYDRANHFRRNNDFDKAMAIYEQILSEDSTDAESYWSLVLCKYGIEYVEDPVTRRRIPTVNRAQFTSVFTDENYQMALKYADVSQRMLYEEEAAAIDEIQKGILAISSKEEPFDVFICYKESDASGARTVDSVLAQDIYYQLTEQGFKVFFARITLESKVGQQYEPYIFAALNSAKVMVIVGTKPEYYNAVWVKNEWSRYLKIAQNDKNRLVIPAYKDMDPYDMPEALSYYQAQDMSKIGFMQDLIRGIKKVLEGVNEKTEKSTESYSSVNNANVAALLKRGSLALEDGDWGKAYDFYDQVLNYDAECADAYIGQALSKWKFSSWKAFCDMQLSGTEAVEKYKVTWRYAPEIAERYAAKVQEYDLGALLSGRLAKEFEVYLTTEARVKQYDALKAAIDGDKLISKGLRFADSGSEYHKELSRVWEEMEKRIEEAKEDEARRTEEIKGVMDEFLQENINKKLEEAMVEKEQRYNQACELYNCGSENKHKIYLAFRALGKYKDAADICSSIKNEYKEKMDKLADEEMDLRVELSSLAGAGFSKRKKKAEIEARLYDLQYEKEKLREEYGQSALGSGMW